ncbi:MAG: aminoacyl-tRNA hydrolase [Puniceicoccales bacterium]|jgi:PTH1 family peptidyl-tRNA hydrolase|nr:aminoacyl-tRNA hydrolase [Puniceicoccales bacterium]
MAIEEKSLTLLVGLGNPGAIYVHTRHNLGQFVLDNFARLQNLRWINNKRLNADLARGRFGRFDYVLVRPLAYMNESGYPVGRIASYFKVKPGRVAIVYDEINLPLGKFKVTYRSGDGGHNGMADVNACVKDCIRFRVGIGPKLDKEMDLKDYVLSKFTDVEQATLLHAMPEILEGLRSLLVDPQMPATDEKIAPAP